MKKLSALLLIALLLVTGCQPSESAIQTAVAQTQAAQPTSTPQPTATQIPTDTPMPTATATITSSPSPTPDVRLIDIDPRKLLLQKSDLPSEGKYYLPNETWTSPHRNSEIVSSWGTEKGQAYLAETGRIDGWWISYKRGSSGGVLVPEEVYDNPVLYSSIEGARLVITKYSDRKITEEKYREIDVPQIGDIARAFTKSEIDSNGRTNAAIYIDFTYRNVLHSINIYGREKEVTLEFAVGIANKLLEGLKLLPLSDTVTFTP